jgi:23S rRNA (pseudouridine1915-N3)-methyltransferase
MRHVVVAVGRPALPFARDGAAEYLKRLERYTRPELQLVKDGPPPKVEERLLAASAGAVRVVLDERGEAHATDSFRQLIDRWESAGHKAVAYLIGGADGHSQTLRDRADLVLALSPLTMQHELALVVLLEQLYRVYTMKRGEPYHR